MGLFLFRFWPVLIPLLVYYIWFTVVARKAEKEGKPRPLFRNGPWYRILFAMLLIALGCFLFLGVSVKATSKKGEYVPPHMENGVMVPGKVREAE